MLAHTHDTGIVVWWVAKQLMRGMALAVAPTDWEDERALATESLREDNDFDALINYR